MAHRHKAHHARGGKAHHGMMDYMQESHKVEHEAGLKKGGRAKHHKHGGKIHGKHGHHRLDKRARGGGVGADKHPFSSAHVKGHGGPATHPHPHSGK